MASPFLVIFKVVTGRKNEDDKMFRKYQYPTSTSHQEVKLSLKIDFPTDT